MIPKNTIKILNLLLRSTDKHGFNINQIAKSLNISVGSAFKILKSLEEKFFVSSEKISNAKHYFLNFNNEPVIKLCEFLLLDERNSLNKHAKLYSETIQEFVGAELIIMFGSILKKKEFNDVDVLFTTTNINKVQSFCLVLSKLRTKPVIPLILNKKDLIKEIKNKNEAILSLVREGVILRGESVFVNILKNART